MNRLRQSQLATWTCSVILAGVMSGCSADSVKTAEVTGTVTRKGKPLEGIRVRFMPNIVKGTSGPSSEGLTDANGMYSVVIAFGYSEQPGAVIGHHRVVIEDYKAENSRGKPMRYRAPMSLMNSSTTEIDIQVLDAEEPQSFDFEVTDYE